LAAGGNASSYAPAREPTRLAVVAVVSEGELGPNQEDLAIEAEQATVVAHALVNHWQTNVAQDAVGQRSGQQLGDRLPRMQVGVDLEEVVLAAVADAPQVSGPSKQLAGVHVVLIDR